MTKREFRNMDGGLIMTLDELWSKFDDDVKEIEEECEREGYPSHGSNFDLRYDDLVKRYHEYEKYCIDYIDEEVGE